MLQAILCVSEEIAWMGRRCVRFGLAAMSEVTYALACTLVKLILNL